MSDYGISYMGSKDKIASSIIAALPKADHFYDLFGGGFAMTHCAIKRFSHKYKYFHYNEIKADVVELVKQAINGDFSYSRKLPEWISKEEFHARKESDAYVRCIWSFGNNQKGYLFGPDIEPYKRSAHQAVVFGEFDETAIKVLGFDQWPKAVETIKQRRLYWKQKVAFDSKCMKRGDLQQLEQLERLQQLQQLQRLERLSATALDYREVEILPNSIVYCDIPYGGTADYGSFDRKAFLDWAASRPFPVYVSEYMISDPRFKLVYEVDKRSLLSTDKKNTKIKIERLYLANPHLLIKS